MSGQKTAIVDYGVGNLKSVSNALAYLGWESYITGDKREIERADAVILPGVGAFPNAIQRLRESGLDRVLIQQTQKKPILGICLGMQLLFDRGEEVSPCQGLGLIPGVVRRIETSQKLPHIGWNSLHFPHSSPLFKGVEEGAYVYFVHSYCAVAGQKEDVAAITHYGTPVTAAVARDHVYGCQFHPEKSGEVGLAILKNFVDLTR